MEIYKFDSLAKSSIEIYNFHITLFLSQLQKDRAQFSEDCFTSINVTKDGHTKVFKENVARQFFLVALYIYWLNIYKEGSIVWGGDLRTFTQT